MFPSAQLPSLSQLQLEMGVEMLRRVGIDDAQAGLARFAFEVEADAEAHWADRLKPSVADAVAWRVEQLSDRAALALATASQQLAAKRIKGVSKHNPEIDNARTLLRWLVERIYKQKARDR